MKYIIIILALISTSCVTQRRCYDKFPPDTVKIVRDTTIYKDTTIYIHLPGDTVRDSIPVPVSIPPDINRKPAEAHTSLAHARAWIENRQLKLELTQKDSLFQVQLDSAIRANKHQETITRIVEKPLPPKPFYKVGFFILLGLVLFTITLLILARFLRRK